MNSTPLLLLPITAVALLTGQPSKNPATTHSESDRIAAILAQPEFQSLIEQLQETTGTLELPDKEDQNWHSGRRPMHAQRHEQGLHTGHLTRPDSSQPEGYFSPARGLTPENEWQQMFPRYALKLAAAR